MSMSKFLVQKTMEEKFFLSSTSAELIEQVGEKYHIAKSQVYKRLSHLGIKAYKENGETWLDAVQVEELDKLAAHIDSGQSMESYECTAIALSESNQLDQTAERVEFNDSPDNDQISQLVRAAQTRAAGVLIAERVLAARFKDNPQMLDEDLRSQVAAAEEAIAPKSVDPNQYANSLIERYLNSDRAA